MASIYLRGKVWWISYFIDGKEILHSLKVRQKKVALHIKNLKELELENGIAKLPSTKTVDDFFEEYKRYAKGEKKPKIYKQEIRRLELFLDIISVKYLKDITTRHIHLFLLEIGKDRCKNTLYHYLKHIKVFFRFAIEMGYVKENLARKIKCKQTRLPPPRFLSQEELEVFLPCVKKSILKPMIMTALYSGLRVNELMNLCWEDINFKKDVLSTTGKGDKFRVIPLNKRLKAILEPLAKKEGLCFTINGKGYKWQPRRPLCSLVKETGLKDVSWHTFRRTFASHHIMNGVSITKVAKWLGHSSPVLTFQRYAHLAPIKDKDIDEIKFS